VIDSNLVTEKVELVIHQEKDECDHALPQPQEQNEKCEKLPENNEEKVQKMAEDGISKTEKNDKIEMTEAEIIDKKTNFPEVAKATTIPHEEETKIEENPFAPAVVTREESPKLKEDSPKIPEKPVDQLPFHSHALEEAMADNSSSKNKEAAIHHAMNAHEHDISPHSNIEPEIKSEAGDSTQSDKTPEQRSMKNPLKAEAEKEKRMENYAFEQPSPVLK
jgi:hypothetical protein